MKTAPWFRTLSTQDLCEVDGNGNQSSLCFWSGKLHKKVSIARGVFYVLVYQVTVDTCGDNFTRCHLSRWQMLGLKSLLNFWQSMHAFNVWRDWIICLWHRKTKVVTKFAATTPSPNYLIKSHRNVAHMRLSTDWSTLRTPKRLYFRVINCSNKLDIKLSYVYYIRVS